MKEFFTKVGAMLGLMLLIMAAIFGIIAGFNYNVLFGIASILLVLAAVPVGYKLVKYLFQ